MVVGFAFPFNWQVSTNTLKVKHNNEISFCCIIYCILYFDTYHTMWLSSPLQDLFWATNALIVRLGTEVKRWDEAASRIERIRRQPAHIVIGPPKGRLCASQWTFTLASSFRNRTNVMNGLHLMIRSYPTMIWEFLPNKVYDISMDQRIDKLWHVKPRRLGTRLLPWMLDTSPDSK